MEYYFENWVFGQALLMNAHLIIQPIIIMLLLTTLLAIWMLLTRIPAMKRLKIHPQKGQNTKDLVKLLPQEVVRVSNNYNHLFEQPLLFYTICVTIAILHHVDTLHLWCAWIYVGIRILHSLIQATVDIVMIRFNLFLLSWIPLTLMIIREALSVF